MTKAKSDSNSRRATTSSESADAGSNAPDDPWVSRFTRHLATDKAASPYTIRNYSQALREFGAWHTEQFRTSPVWNTLQRDVFRGYLRSLGRANKSRAAIQLRFSAFRSFYRFLIRHGETDHSPIKALSLPKSPRRIPGS